MFSKKIKFHTVVWVIFYTYFILNTAHSSEKNTIRCEYNAGNNQFTQSVTTDSSITVNQVFRGIRKKIFIKDVNALSENEDYIILTQYDKNVIFSLKCKKM